MADGAGGSPLPYTRFDPAELILRDELALDRTILANERTYLAYVRTAIALILAGVSFIHFSEALWFTLLGVASVPIGFLVLGLGLRRYRKVRYTLAAIRQRQVVPAPGSTTSAPS